MLEKEGQTYKIARFVANFLYLICPIVGTFCSCERSYDAHMPYTVHFLVLFCLYNHFLSLFIKLQFPKWKIGIKMDHFVFESRFLLLFYKKATCYVTENVDVMGKSEYDF